MTALDKESPVYQELVRRWEQDFIPAFNDGFKQAQACFCEDSIFIPHDSDIIQGKSNIEARNHSQFQTSQSKCTSWEIEDIGTLGDAYAYTIFNMKCLFVESAKEVSVRSFSVWKNIDDVWMIYRDQYNWL